MDDREQSAAFEVETPRKQSIAGIDTPLCRQLGIKLPIVNAPIGTAASPQLAAAVSNAGGLGVIAVSLEKHRDDIKAAIEQVRALTDRPFGVNLLLKWPQEERLAVCLEQRVPVVSLFWGDPTEHVPAIYRAGSLLMHSIGSVAAAVQAAQAGADVILAQGWEAGGHVIGETSTMALVPQVVDAVRHLPVVAAGGICDGRGVAAALMLGAAGVALGTRFVASKEASVPDIYRELLIRADATDTVFGETFDKGWPNSNMRTLINSTMRRWLDAGRPPIGDRPGEHDVIAHAVDGTTLSRYHVTQPHPNLEGDQEALALYAGQGVGLIKDILAAADIVRRLTTETVSAWHTMGEKLIRPA